MKIDTNANAIYNAFQAQPVAANNPVNPHPPTDSAPAGAVHGGDRVNISHAARSAAQHAGGEEASPSDAVEDMMTGETD